MSDTSVGSQSPGAPELVEILKQLGSHHRKAWDQTYGKEHWTHEESDAYWQHPVLLACRWLEEHSGIKREDLEAAAFRLTTPLGLRGMPDLQGPNGRVDKGMPDWLWMIPKFRELDEDGTTAKLWQMLLDECPAVLVETGLMSATDATPPARKPDEGEGKGDPPLGERALLVLKVLLENKAFGPDHRMTTEEIAVKAAGKGTDANPYKAVVVSLGRLGYVDTKEGRGGGCWLTASGRQRAEKL